MRSSSGTIWSFHAVHSISAIVSAPYRLATSVAHPSTQSCRYASLHGRNFVASASFEKSVKRRSARYVAAVVGELGAGVDVELLADVEAGLGIGDAVVDPGELRDS